MLMTRALKGACQLGLLSAVSASAVLSVFYSDLNPRPVKHVGKPDKDLRGRS